MVSAGFKNMIYAISIAGAHAIAADYADEPTEHIPPLQTTSTCTPENWRIFEIDTSTLESVKNRDALLKLAHTYFCGTRIEDTRILRRHLPKRISSTWTDPETNKTGINYISREDITPIGGSASNAHIRERSNGIVISFARHEGCLGSIYLRNIAGHWLITDESINCC